MCKFHEIGFLVFVLSVINDENWFRVFEESSQAFLHIQIVLNILCQFFAHTLATVAFNISVNFMSIGFLVVVLLMIDDENWFRVFEESSQSLWYPYYIQYIPLRPNFSIHYHNYNMKRILSEMHFFTTSNTICSRKVLQWEAYMVM